MKVRVVGAYSLAAGPVVLVSRPTVSVVETEAFDCHFAFDMDEKLQRLRADLAKAQIEAVRSDLDNFVFVGGAHIREGDAVEWLGRLAKGLADARRLEAQAKEML